MKVWCVEKPWSGPEKYFSTKEKAKKYVEKMEPDGRWKGNNYYLTREGAKIHHVIYGRMPEYMIESVMVK